MTAPFQPIHDAHQVLEQAVAELAKPGRRPFPISIVSVTDEITGQLIVFNEAKTSPSEVVKRLRLAADFIEQQIT